MQKFYKLRHKPSGLFFTPNTSQYSGDKNNLSKIGKTYNKKPSAKHIEKFIWTGDFTEEKLNIKPVYDNRMRSWQIDFLPQDWEIVEYTTQETNVFTF